MTITDTNRSDQTIDLFGNLDEVRDVLTEHAAEAEEIRTLPTPCVEVMREAGLFAMASPREVGGLEVDPLTQLAVVTEISAIDTNAGWTLMIGAHGAQILGVFASDIACDRIFGGDKWPIAGSQISPFGGVFEPVEGGYIVNGRWSFASGIRHAQWSMITASLREDLRLADGEVPQIAAALPIEDLQIHDNWYVMGLKGTGSCDYSVTDLFVPAEMTWSLPPKVKRGGSRYLMRVPQAMLAGFGVGAARHALAAITALAKTKIRPNAPTAVGNRPYFHHTLGELETRLACAEAGLVKTVEEMWLGAQRGDAPSKELELRLAAVVPHVHSVASEVCATALRFGGSSAARLDNVLQRLHRDMSVGAQHMQASEQNFEPLGRFRLGLDS